MLTIKGNKKIVASLALASTILFSSSLCLARQITMTPQQEYEAANTSIRNLGWPMAEIKDLNTVLNHMVSFNSDKLRQYTDGKQRGIPGIYITYKNVNNSYTVLGGSIIISNDFLNTLLYNPAKGHPERIDEIPAYRQSAVAAVISHECSHWYRNDGVEDLNHIFAGDAQKQNEAQKYINKGDYISLFKLESKTINGFSQKKLEEYRHDSMLKEDIADADGMDFLNNHPVYSVGGMVMFLSCANDEGVNREGTDVNAHRTLNERYNVAIDYIRKISYGRVEVRNKLLYLDGQKFMGTGKLPARRDVTSYDRTLYVAGQLASAVNHGLTARSSSSAIVEPRYAENLYRNKNLNYLVVKNSTDDNLFFILDFVPVELGRMKGLVKGNVQPSNDEEQIVVEIAKFLNKK